MGNELSQRERALRRLPLPYSLALRLRDAGISAELIRQFVNIEQAALDRLYRIAEVELLAAQNATDDRHHWCQ
jgi:hypothetical protein